MFSWVQKIIDDFHAFEKEHYPNQHRETARADLVYDQKFAQECVAEGFYVLLDEKVIGLLTDWTWIDMFWSSFHLEAIDPNIVWFEHWENIVLRNRKYSEIWGEGIPTCSGNKSGRIIIRGFKLKNKFGYMLPESSRAEVLVERHKENEKKQA